mmetsp:Transcript_118207/g.306985  ORF Transcript_118207/g.306985 Transcript_118207/m.306985 type:complete len:370 (-) Transcript_118207:124-1233(-)
MQRCSQHVPEEDVRLPDFAGVVGEASSIPAPPGVLNVPLLQYMSLLEMENRRLWQHLERLCLSTEHAGAGAVTGQRDPIQASCVAQHQPGPTMLPRLLGSQHTCPVSLGCFGTAKGPAQRPPPGLPPPPHALPVPTLQSVGLQAMDSISTPIEHPSSDLPLASALATTAAAVSAVVAAGEPCLRVLTDMSHSQLDRGVTPSSSSMGAAVVEWRIHGLRAKLRVSNGFPLLSPSFDVGSFSDLRVMFVPGEKWAAFAGTRALKKSSRRQAQQHQHQQQHQRQQNHHCHKLHSEAGGDSSYGFGAVKLKAGSVDLHPGCLAFRLCVGRSSGRDIVTCNFAEHAVHGCDLRHDWRRQVEGDGDTLCLRLEIL